MFGLVKRSKVPKEYPSFDQMCAYFYVIAASGKIKDNSIDDEFELNSLYFKHAVRKKSKNPLKKIRSSLKSQASVATGSSVGQNDIIGVDFSGACQEVLNRISGTKVIRIVFDRAQDGYWRGEDAITAAAIVEQIGESARHQPSHDGSVLEGIVIDDVDDSGVRKVPHFYLAEEEDFTPDQISQLIQSYMIGLASRARNKLEAVDAVLNAEKKTSEIARRVGGGVEKLEYSDDEVSQRLLLERE